MTIGELCASSTGSRDPRRSPRSTFTYVDISAVDNQAKTISGARDVLGQDAPSRARRVIKANDVIVSMTRPNLNAVALVPDHLDGQICSTGFAVLRANGRVLPEYLFQTVTTPAFVFAVSSATSGALYPAITESFLRQFRIPLPPLDEQRRIVDILNRAASIRRLRDQANATLRALIPALFIKMFGNSAAGFADWEEVTIDDLLVDRKASLRTGPFGSQLKHSEFTEHGVPVLGIDNVVSNRFRWAKPRHVPPEKYRKFQRFRVFPGDVLITIMGTAGRACVAPADLPECMSTKHLCVLTIDQSVADPTYVWGTLLYDEAVRAQTRVRGQGQIMEGWNMSIVRSLSLKLPPLSAQRTFAQRVHALHGVESMAERAESAAVALPGSLMQRMLGNTS